MAIACFCGLPAFISVLMLAEMVALEEPFFRGIYHCDIFHKPSYAVIPCDKFHKQGYAKRTTYSFIFVYTLVSPLEAVVGESPRGV